LDPSAVTVFDVAGGHYIILDFEIGTFSAGWLGEIDNIPLALEALLYMMQAS